MSQFTTKPSTHNIVWTAADGQSDVDMSGEYPTADHSEAIAMAIAELLAQCSDDAQRARIRAGTIDGEPIDGIRATNNKHIPTQLSDCLTLDDVMRYVEHATDADAAAAEYALDCADADDRADRDVLSAHLDILEEAGAVFDSQRALGLAVADSAADAND